MKRTIARKEFKEQFGQSNHFLITSLIGLNIIEKSEEIIKPEEFSTSWNPKDKNNSLSKWSNQNWMTKSGLPSSITHERYLPEKATTKQQQSNNKPTQTRM